MVPHACFTCTNFIAKNGIKASGYSALYPLAQPAERSHEGISVTGFQSGHWTFHTGFPNGPVLPLSCDSFNLHIFEVTAFPTGGADTVFFQHGYYCVVYSLFVAFPSIPLGWHKGLSKQFLNDQWRIGNRKLWWCNILLCLILLSWVLCQTLQDKLAFLCFNKRVLNYLVSNLHSAIMLFNQSRTCVLLFSASPLSHLFSFVHSFIYLYKITELSIQHWLACGF